MVDKIRVRIAVVTTSTGGWAATAADDDGGADWGFLEECAMTIEEHDGIAPMPSFARHFVNATVQHPALEEVAADGVESVE